MADPITVPALTPARKEAQRLAEERRRLRESQPIPLSIPPAPEPPPPPVPTATQQPTPRPAPTEFGLSLYDPDMKGFRNTSVSELKDKEYQLAYLSAMEQTGLTGVQGFRESLAQDEMLWPDELHQQRKQLPFYDPQYNKDPLGKTVGFAIDTWNVIGEISHEAATIAGESERIGSPDITGAGRRQLPRGTEGWTGYYGPEEESQDYTVDEALAREVAELPLSRLGTGEFSSAGEFKDALKRRYEQRSTTEKVFIDAGHPLNMLPGVGYASLPRTAAMKAAQGKILPLLRQTETGKELLSGVLGPEGTQALREGFQRGEYDARTVLEVLKASDPKGPIKHKAVQRLVTEWLDNTPATDVEMPPFIRRIAGAQDRPSEMQRLIVYGNGVQVPRPDPNNAHWANVGLGDAVTVSEEDALNYVQSVLLGPLQRAQQAHTVVVTIRDRIKALGSDPVNNAIRQSLNDYGTGLGDDLPENATAALKAMRELVDGEAANVKTIQGRMKSVKDAIDKGAKEAVERGREAAKKQPDVPVTPIAAHVVVISSDDVVMHSEAITAIDDADSLIEHLREDFIGRVEVRKDSLTDPYTANMADDGLIRTEILADDAPVVSQFDEVTGALQTEQLTEISPAAASEVQRLTGVVESLPGMMNDTRKAQSLRRIGSTIDALDDTDVEGLDDLRNAIEEYGDVERAGMSIDEFNDEKQSLWEAVSDAMDGLVVDADAIGERIPAVRAAAEAAEVAPVAEAEGFRSGVSSKSLPPRESLVDNFRKPLSEYADSLYHETDIQEAAVFMGGVRTEMGSVYVANSANLAQGQGGKGVMLKFSAGPEMQGQIRKKPMWEAVWDNGEAEFFIRHSSQSHFVNNLVSVTIDAAAVTTRPQKQRMNNLLRGWDSVANADGSVTYMKPAPQAAAPTPSVAAPVAQVAAEVAEVAAPTVRKTAAADARITVKATRGRLETLNFEAVLQLKREGAETRGWLIRPRRGWKPEIDYSMLYPNLAAAKRAIQAAERAFRDEAGVSVIPADGQIVHSVNEIPVSDTPGGVERWSREQRRKHGGRRIEIPEDYVPSEVDEAGVVREGRPPSDPGGTGPGGEGGPIQRVEDGGAVQLLEDAPSYKVESEAAELAERLWTAKEPPFWAKISTPRKLWLETKRALFDVYAYANTTQREAEAWWLTRYGERLPVDKSPGIQASLHRGSPIAANMRLNDLAERIGKALGPAGTKDPNLRSEYWRASGWRGGTTNRNLLAEYLHAMHMIEVLRMHPKRVRPSEFHTIPHYKAMIKNVAKKAGTEGYRRVQEAGQIVSDEYARMLDERVAEGLIKSSISEKLKQMYPFYHPLRYLETQGYQAMWDARSPMMVQQRVSGVTDNDLRFLADIADTDLTAQDPITLLSQVVMNHELSITMNRTSRAMVEALSMLPGGKKKGFQEMKATLVSHGKDMTPPAELWPRGYEPYQKKPKPTWMQAAKSKAPWIPKKTSSVREMPQGVYAYVTDPEMGPRRATEMRATQPARGGRVQAPPRARPPDEGTQYINYWENGEPRIFQVPYEAARDMAQLSRFDRNMVQRALHAVQNPFRWGFTSYNPAWMAMNWMLESMQLAVVHGIMPWTSGKHLYGAVYDIFQTDGVMQSILRGDFVPQITGGRVQKKPLGFLVDPAKGYVSSEDLAMQRALSLGLTGKRGETVFEEAMRGRVNIRTEHDWSNILGTTRKVLNAGESILGRPAEALEVAPRKALYTTYLDRFKQESYDYWYKKALASEREMVATRAGMAPSPGVEPASYGRVPGIPDPGLGPLEREALPQRAAAIAEKAVQDQLGSLQSRAAYEARTGMIDYQRWGSAIHLLDSAWLYLNAGVQGTMMPLRYLSRPAVADKGWINKRYPHQTRLAMGTAGLMALNADVFKHNMETTNERNNYWSIPLEDRIGGMVLLMPGDGIQTRYGKWLANYWKLWPSRETSIITGTQTWFLEKMHEKGHESSVKQLVSAIGSELNPFQSILPIERQGETPIIGDVPPPTMLLGVVEEAVNNRDSYTRSPIVPESLEDAEPRDQYDAYTSDFARAIGLATSLGFTDGVSPMLIDHAVKWGAWQDAISGSDWFLQKFDANQPHPLIEAYADELIQITEGVLAAGGSIDGRSVKTITDAYLNSLRGLPASEFADRTEDMPPAMVRYKVNELVGKRMKIERPPIVRRFLRNRTGRSFAIQTAEDYFGVKQEDQAAAVRRLQADRQKIFNEQVILDQGLKNYRDAVTDAGNVKGPNEWKEEHFTLKKMLRMNVLALGNQYDASSFALEGGKRQEYSEMLHTLLRQWTDEDSRADLLYLMWRATAESASQDPSGEDAELNISSKNPRPVYVAQDIFMDALSDDDRDLLNDTRRSRMTPMERTWDKALETIKPYWQQDREVLTQLDNTPRSDSGGYTDYELWEAWLNANKDERSALLFAEPVRLKLFQGYLSSARSMMLADPKEQALRDELTFWGYNSNPLYLSQKEVNRRDAFKLAKPWREDPMAPSVKPMPAAIPGQGGMAPGQPAPLPKDMRAPALPPQIP